MTLLERLRARLPGRDQILRSRWLAWLGPWLHQPKLWHWSRRGVAMGVGVGVFFGLLIPIAQIPLSVGAAVLVRANIPAAVTSTLISNPFTFGPIYYGAYRLGVWVTGDKKLPDHVDIVGTRELASTLSLWQRITTVGRPLMVGLSIAAVLMGLLTYGLISLAWRWRTLSKRRKRRRRTD